MNDQLRLAGAILTDLQGRVWLLHRNKGKRNQWEVPGGKIDELVDGLIVRSHASPEATVVRELKEELDVDIEIIRRLGHRDFQEDGYTMQFIWYLGTIIGNAAPRIAEPDVFDDLRAFSQADMSHFRDRLSGNTKNFLDAWASGQFTLS